MRKMLFIAALMMLGTTIRADYLYWMVAEDYSSYDATLYAFNASDSSVSPHVIGTATSGQIKSAWDDDPVVPFSADLTGYQDGWSYYIELVNGSSTLNNKDSAIAYSASSPYISRGGLSVPTGITGGFGSDPMSGGTYNVPEPTSGLLFLIGGMLLGLKRRRQQV